jgi:hypothetical protein
MDPAAQLQPYLRGGEQLLWSGQPDPRVWLTPADAFMIPFSILWAAFAIFWEAGVISSRDGAFGAVLGTPLIPLGLYLVFGRFVYKHHRKQRTVYGITSQRAITVVAPRTVLYTPLAYEPVTIQRSRDARHASVFIGRQSAPYPGSIWLYADTGFVRGPRPFAFYDVAEPEAMLSALDQARGGQFTA